MKNLLLVLLLLIVFTGTACETVRKGTETAGSAVSKTMDATVGGATDGMADGYKPKDVTANNPYGR